MVVALDQVSSNFMLRSLGFSIRAPASHWIFVPARDSSPGLPMKGPLRFRAKLGRSLISSRMETRIGIRSLVTFHPNLRLVIAAEKLKPQRDLLWHRYN